MRLRRSHAVALLCCGLLWGSRGGSGAEDLPADPAAEPGAGQVLDAKERARLIDTNYPVILV
jgi:hypothetical protein